MSASVYVLATLAGRGSAPLRSIPLAAALHLLTAVVFLLPLAALPAAALGWLRARRRAARTTSALPARVIVQVTTVDGAATREVLAAVRALPCPVPIELWVVTEPGPPHDYADADRVIVVPHDFRCQAVAKGRALEWARLVRRDEGIVGRDVKVLLLDDDSVPSARYLDLAVRADADVAQGAIVPSRHYGRGLSHLDDLRPMHCLLVCSWAQGTGHPVHVHGEGLCLRASAEQSVTWDRPGAGLAEDLVFGQRAADRGLRWAFLPAAVAVTSPWTVGAFVTQRRRWTWGTLDALRVMSRPATVRVTALYVCTLGAFVLSSVQAVSDVLSGRAVSAVWLAGLVAWLLSFALVGWFASGGRLAQALLASALAWPTALANALVLPLSLLLGRPGRFELIRKVAPARAPHRVLAPVAVTAAATAGCLALVLGGLGLGGGSSLAPDARAHDGRPSAQVAARNVARTLGARPDLRRGLTVIAYGNDAFFAHKARRLLGRLAGLGVTHVSLTVPLFTTGRTAAAVAVDRRRTPSPARILAFARAAHERGLTVGLSPLLDEEVLAAGDSWRGELQPADRDAWFRSYARVLGRFARIARRGHFNALTVGTELESLQTDARWRTVLGAVRRHYAGTVAYAMAGTRILDHRLGWLVRHVDVVGVNAWYGLALPDRASLPEMEREMLAWRPALDRMRRQVHRPVVFTEAGLPSQRGAYRTPTAIQRDVPADELAQARNYRAVCRLARRARVAGVLWWATTLDPPRTPATDTGYDPLGKAAAREIRACRLR